MNNKIKFSPELMKATGRFQFGFTNDYMFRIIFQENKTALKGLLSSLLHIPHEQIVSLEIKNPVVVGKAFDDKEFRLDIKAELNNERFIDLEMQIANYENWPERSIGYLCRMYDSLKRGEDYNTAKPAIHISILDYTLFPDSPVFYSTNLLTDTKTGKIYSDKFMLNVLDLKHIELANEDDKYWGIDYWDKLFKSTTWEEIKMIAAKNDFLSEASNTFCNLYADENVRDRCRDREEYYYTMKYYEDGFKQKDITIERQKNTIEEQKGTIEEQKGTIEEQRVEIVQKDEQIAQKDEQIAQKDEQIAQKDLEIAQKDELIRQFYAKMKLQQKDE